VLVARGPHRHRADPPDPGASLVGRPPGGRRHPLWSARPAGAAAAFSSRPRDRFHPSFEWPTAQDPGAPAAGTRKSLDASARRTPASGSAIISLAAGFMRAVPLLALCLATLPAQAPKRPAPSGSDDKIVVEVNRVPLLFTVTDKKGRFVTDLQEKEFKVFDNR